MDRAQEVEGMALWVHQHHGERGPVFIAEQIGRCVLEGEPGGVDLWRSVAMRYDALDLRPEFPDTVKAGSGPPL